MNKKVSSESFIKDIRRRTRKKYSSEEKIRIVLEGLRGEDSIANLCRREGIPTNLYYLWSKGFLEAGKKRLMGDTAREANSREVADFNKENEHLKQLVCLYFSSVFIISISLKGQNKIIITHQPISNFPGRVGLKLDDQVFLFCRVQSLIP